MGPGNHVLDGGPDLPMGRGKFLGENGHPTVVCGKTAELIGMPFGLSAGIGRRNYVMDGGSIEMASALSSLFNRLFTPKVR